MGRKGWTNEEIDIIKKYYPLEGIGVRVRLKDRTDNQIYGIAWHYKIKNYARKKRDDNMFPMRRYSSEELQYIKDHLETDGAEAVADKLCRTVNAVRSMASKIKQKEREDEDDQYGWTDEEIDIVRKYYPVEGIKVKDRLPNRSMAAVYSEASHLGVAHNKRQRKSSNSAWSDEEDDIIRKYYKQDGIKKCCELLPSRSKQAIVVRANRYLGIKRS